LPARPGIELLPEPFGVERVFVEQRRCEFALDGARDRRRVPERRANTHSTVVALDEYHRGVRLHLGPEIRPVALFRRHRVRQRDCTYVRDMHDVADAGQL
jgi:hypothetical protein